MKILSLFFLFFISQNLFSQHTFSIVAVDTLTGEVGSAGASCVDDNSFPGSGGAFIISDILPGRGAIHTQSYYLQQNQLNARQKMAEGLSPQEIITWLQFNDVQSNPGIRQYGIAAFAPGTLNPSAAAHTGLNCLNYKNHRVGKNYSIQGNILLGKKVLDSMENNFLKATGTLADRLMACMQGANMVGADSRCTSNGTSSLSAFLRVAKPDDDLNNLFLDLNVPSLPTKTEPIDSLQTLYDHWKQVISTDEPTKFDVKMFPNPARGEVVLQILGTGGQVKIFDLAGNLKFQEDILEGQNVLRPVISSGTFILQVVFGQKITMTKRLVWVN